MPLITKLAFALLHATALTAFLSSSYVNAEDNAVTNSSIHQDITYDVHLIKESSQLEKDTPALRNMAPNGEEDKILKINQATALLELSLG